MKAKLLSSLAGPGCSHSVGEVIERDADECGRLFAGGIAEPVEESDRPAAEAARARSAQETADRPPPETAARVAPARRRRRTAARTSDPGGSTPPPDAPESGAAPGPEEEGDGE